MGKVDALPARPSLEFLKKLAKQQVVALRRQGTATSLAAVQLTLARKYGFPSWRKLKAHVESLKQAAAAVEAISSGDTKSLKRLLSQNSSLANTRVDNERTLLHVATDWPGHFPNNMETIAALVASGADVNAAFAGRHSETPLHWAASSNDVGAIDVLLDHGANIEARGSVIGGGTAMSDAVAFGQWQAARRLLERGAQTTLWQAAALGLMDRVDECFKAVPPSPSSCRFELGWIRQAFAARRSESKRRCGPGAVAAQPGRQVGERINCRMTGYSSGIGLGKGCRPSTHNR